MLSNKFNDLFKELTSKFKEIKDSIRYKQYDFHYETAGDVSIQPIYIKYTMNRDFNNTK